MDLEAAIARHFATLYRDRDYATHFAGYADEALVLVGPRAVRVDSITAADYAEVITEIARLKVAPVGTPLRKPAFGAFRVTESRVTGREAIAHISVVEVVTGRSLSVAVALKAQPDWKVVSLAFVDGEVLPDYASVLIRGLAELAQVPQLQSADDLFLTALELAYHRAYAPPGLPLASLPESRFTCQNSGHCCEDWGVAVTDNAVLAIDHMPFDRLGIDDDGTWVESDGHGGSQLTHACGACAFRRDKGCELHRHAGGVPIATCFAFPVVFTLTPEGLNVGGSFACPSVRANVGERYADRTDDFSRRARATGDYLGAVPEFIRLDESAALLDWHEYRELETALLGALADRTLSVAERFSRCAGLYRAVTEGDLALPIGRRLHDTAPWVVRTDILPLVAEALTPLGLGLYTLFKRQRPETLELLPASSDLERMQLPNWLEGLAIRFEANDDLMTRYLRQLLWRKTDLAEAGALYQIRSVMLAYNLVKAHAMTSAFVAGRDVTLDSDIQEAVRAVEIATLHSDHLRRVVREQPQMRALMSHPEMGDYLIRQAEIGVGDLMAR